MLEAIRELVMGNEKRKCLLSWSACQSVYLSTGLMCVYMLFQPSRSLCSFSHSFTLWRTHTQTLSLSLSLSFSLSFLLCTSSLNRNREPLFVFAIERKASFNSGYFDSQARKINEFSEIIVKVWWFWWLVYSLSCLWVCCIVVTFIEVWSVNELSKNFIVDFCRSHCDVCVVKKYVFVLVRICFFFNPCQFPLFECMKWSWSGNNHAVTQKYVESRVVVVI